MRDLRLTEMFIFIIGIFIFHYINVYYALLFLLCQITRNKKRRAGYHASPPVSVSPRIII